MKNLKNALVAFAFVFAFGAAAVTHANSLLETPVFEFDGTLPPEERCYPIDCVLGPPDDCQAQNVALTHHVDPQCFTPDVPVKDPAN